MSDPPTPATPERPASRKLQVSRRNEQLKLIAGSLDRLCTITLAGAVLTPIFQHEPLVAWQVIAWAIVALLLHGMAQFMLNILREET